MANERTATFSPANVKIVVSQGTWSHVMSGYAEDTFVRVVPQSDKFEMYIGADRTATRVYKGNEAGTIEVTLQQTSSSNDILSQIYKNDIANPSAETMFTITVRDNSGRSLYYAEEAYIGKTPDSDFANSMQTRQWSIMCPRLQEHIGGNSKFSPEDAATFEALGGTIDPRWAP